MDEPLITKITIDETPKSSPQQQQISASSFRRNFRFVDDNTPRSPAIYRRQYASGYLDRLLSRQTTFQRRQQQQLESTTVVDGSIISRSSTLRRQFQYQPSSGYLDITGSAATVNVVDGGVLPTLVSATPNTSIASLIVNLEHKRRLTRRSHSAPAIFTDEKEEHDHSTHDPNIPDPKSTPTVVRLAFLGLVIYITIGISLFIFTNSNFSGVKTVAPVDGMYFMVVTLCTIGYGDIVPDTTFTKLCTCVFILVGFGFIDILLNGLVTYVLDRQEEVLLGAVDENRFNTLMTAYVVDKKKRRMRIRTKVGLAMGVVVICILIGTVTAHYLESMSWVDSFYMAVTSVTTVGYGDYNFKTVQGRCFAVVWLLLSTLAVARAFLYLTEFRLDRRNRKAAKWVLKKKLTRADLVLADLDNDGSISKSEYVIHKLKEMGKIAEKDILQICQQFDSLENSYGGRITFGNIEESDSD